MSKSNTTENDILKHIFNNTAMPAYGSILYVSLHTSDPGEAGTQTSNEADYTGYTRIGVARDAGGWAVVGSNSANVAEITFPECTAGANTITHVAVGLASSGASQILYSGALTAPINVSALITPRFPAGTLIMQED